MTASTTKFEAIRGPDVVTSPLDLRSYRAFTLRNGIKVLLASDSSSDKAAASLDVAVGSFSDPDSLPGLAHFLEHMLFLGTAKYPEEDSYNNFLAENGGCSNAYTSSENTNYHFQMVVPDKDVDHSSNTPDGMPKFKEALDRFAQFFTAPLFTESATERELNAVDSEHEKNIQSDSSRTYQMRKEQTNKDHPMSKFGTGSKETLGVTPAENGIDTREALLEFHRNYYSANLMNLCISGPHELDVMEAWIAELFSAIPNSDISNPCEAYRHIEPLLEEQKGLIFYRDTIKDIRHLEVAWTTPCYRKDYHSKPMEYVTNLLGDEGQGSFLSLLKKRGWGDSVGSEFSHYMTFSVFHLTITLTSEGAKFVDEILCLMYQYIRMIRETGVKEWLFEEMQALSQNTFRFLEKHEPLSFVTHTSSLMHRYPPGEYLCGPHMYKEYSPGKIEELLDVLTPRNGNIVVAGNFVAEKATKTEKWYKTPYHVEPINREKISRWCSADICEELHIPEPNPFVPTDFEILGKQMSDGSRDEEGPQKIFQDKYMEVHYKLDRSFNRPKAVLCLELSSPVAYQSPLQAVLATLLTCLLEDELTEYAYPAEKAGFFYQLDLVCTGIRLIVRGYSHRIDVLIDAIVRKITTYVVDPARLEIQRDFLERHFANFHKGQPYTVAMYNSTQLLEDPRWHVDDYLERIRDGSVTVEALTAYLHAFKERMFITSLVFGNISEEGAISIMKSMQTTIGYTPRPEAEQVKRRVVQAPLGIDVYTRMKHTNPEDKNSAIEVLYPTGPRGDFAHDAKLELLGDILNKPAFHELRTVQQLGYIVFEGVGGKPSKRGIFFIVQSTVADPDVLLDRIDSFLAEARVSTLESMTEDIFKQYVTSLIANKAEPDTNLRDRAFRFWKEIDDETFEYGRKQKEIEALKTVTKEEVLEFFDVYIALGGSKRRRIIAQVFGNEHPVESRRSLQKDAMEVTNVIAFRRQNPLYPVSSRHPIREVPS